MLVSLSMKVPLVTCVPSGEIRRLSIPLQNLDRNFSADRNLLRGYLTTATAQPSEIQFWQSRFGFPATKGNSQS
jgi:hypothetical protein